MDNNKFRLSLVFSIIILFFSISLMPVISGNIEKNSSMFHEMTPKNFSTWGDGLLAYWSFDEGDGNVVYDYSGHGYDGIRNGASWTTGYSGYALDFDGSNDYVSIDFYSEDLGFNKTDDYKISLWFNSISTDTGKIYEISDSDGLPMAYIRLNSDGNLEVKVQTTTSCDVKVYSTNSYNDGLWHFVECIFHGDSLEPTLELYVDEELVGSDTDWLCPQSSNMFKRAKIGMTSYESTENFEGVIDEVKVYKKPEGNQPPDAPTIEGPTVGTIGEEYSYTFLATDPEGGDIYYWIDWGDGNNTGWIGPYCSNEEVNVNYTWSENGLFEIRAKTRDIFYDMSEWTTLLVAMGNIAPNAPTITGPTTGREGEENEYTFVTTDLNEHDVKYYVDWGDGSNSGWTDYYNSGAEVTIGHTWSEKGTYIIKAKAKDIHDAESEWSELYMVNITQKTFIFGLITNMSLNGELTSFNAKLLLYISLNPFKSKLYYSGEEIIILNEYLGKINEESIFGFFNAAVMQNSYLFY